MQGVNGSMVTSIVSEVVEIREESGGGGQFNSNVSGVFCTGGGKEALGFKVEC